MKLTRVILSTCAVVSSVVCISAYSVASSEPSVSFSVAKPYAKETALKPKVEILEPLGPLHDISEPDILEAFKSRVDAMKASGEYDRRFNQNKDRISKELEHPTPVVGLKRAKELRVWELSASVPETLPESLLRQAQSIPMPHLSRSLLFVGGSFNASYSKELKELMMTLVGTVIYVREGSGKDTVTRAIPIAGQDLVGFLFGRPDTQVLESEAFRLRCVEEDRDDRCLTVKKTTLDEVNLPYEFMKAASNYRNSILRRDPNLVSEADMLLLASSSTIPLIRLINATASHRYLGFSQDIMRIYVEAAAFEAVIRAMDRLSLDIKAAASASSASQTGVIAAEHLKVIEARIDEVRKDIASRSDAVFQQMSRAHSFITQIEHLERSVKGALAADLAANLSFGENL